MRLAPQAGGRIDRSRPVTFMFQGKPVAAFEGDTIGSALFAGGQRVFSRSFKYHRKRGLLCCSGHCPNCMMQVEGVPNVRVCTEPVRQGVHVQAQNVLGSLDYDLLAVVDKFGGPFTPVGFYYRTMIRPRRAWPLYERFLRSVAGLGRVDTHAERSGRFDAEHRHADVLVIGGGRSGLEAARRYAAAGRRVVVVDVDEPPNDDAFESIRGVALGIYEGNLVPVDAGNVLYRFRAEHIVVAAGALEQPLVFPGNDLVGVLLPEAVRRLVGRWSLRPGERAVVVSMDEHAFDVVPLLERAGTDVVEVVDLRETRMRQIAADGKKGRLSAVQLEERRIDCDLLVTSGGRPPAYPPPSPARAPVGFEPRRGIFLPVE